MIFSVSAKKKQRFLTSIIIALFPVQIFLFAFIYQLFFSRDFYYQNVKSDPAFFEASERVREMVETALENQENLERITTIYRDYTKNFKNVNDPRNLPSVGTISLLIRAPRLIEELESGVYTSFEFTLKEKLNDDFFKTFLFFCHPF